MDIDDRSSDCSRCELRYIPFQAVLKYFFEWFICKLLIKYQVALENFEAQRPV